jgi:hypothetical protein
MQTYRGVDVYISAFLNSLLVGELSAEPRGRTPITYWIGVLVDPRVGLGDFDPT